MDTTVGKGYVQIYTGNGKGKTTAALGLAFRAMGNGLKTYIGQFMKGRLYGELEAVKMVQPWITLEQFGSPDFIYKKDVPDEENRKKVLEGMEKAKTALQSGKYTLVILDELVTTLHFKLTTPDEVLEIIRLKPDGVELVLTGRYAPQQLTEAADLVTEMKDVKHYYTAGISARKGIEY